MMNIRSRSGGNLKQLKLKIWSEPSVKLSFKTIIFTYNDLVNFELNYIKEIVKNDGLSFNRRHCFELAQKITILGKEKREFESFLKGRSERMHYQSIQTQCSCP